MRDFLILQVKLYKFGEQSIGIDKIYKLAKVYFDDKEIKELEELQ